VRKRATLVRMGLVTGIAALLSIVSNPGLSAQDPPQRWERRVEATQPPITIFHSTQAINLPTAVTLSSGEWQFEIAHRFFPPVSEGQEAFWGLDGPVFMRIGLGYAVSDRALITLARSNFQDNWDLQGKLQLLEWQGGPLPLTAAVQGGAAWSSEVSGRESGDKGNFQYYGQLILNARIGDRLAVGVVPSYLYNVLLDSIDPVQDLYLGLYSQLYLTDVLSVLGEWNLGENRAELGYDAAAVGLELETGGHFFKLFLTNSIRLNPSQYLVGTDQPFEPGEWRLGFSITRLLRF
jgi:hypothetical protein